MDYKLVIEEQIRELCKVQDKIIKVFEPTPTGVCTFHPAILNTAKTISELCNDVRSYSKEKGSDESSPDPTAKTGIAKTL